MNKNYLNNKGITLIELLIVMSIMLMVMGIGYSLYYFAQNSFSNYEERWIVQNESRSVSRYLEDQLDTIYSCEILENIINNFEDDYSYVYGKDNDLFIRYTDEKNNVQTVKLNKETLLTIEFIHGTDSSGNMIDNFLQFDIKSVSIDYNILNGVELRNLGKNMSIDGTNSGNGLKFKSVSIISELPELDYSTFCVVATASYGTYQEPSVRLLRRFRDEFLMKFDFGQRFVKFYYSNAQPISQVISKSYVLRWLTRMILYPVIAVSAMILNESFRFFALLYLIIYIYLYDIFKKHMIYHYKIKFK